MVHKNIMFSSHESEQENTEGDNENGISYNNRSTYSGIPGDTIYDGGSSLGLSISSDTTYNGLFPSVTIRGRFSDCYILKQPENLIYNNSQGLSCQKRDSFFIVTYIILFFSYLYNFIFHTIEQMFKRWYNIKNMFNFSH